MADTRILAQGTFDLVHPGHVHYLEESAALGGELHVIVGRHEDETSAKTPLLPAEQRRDVVAAFEMVDEAHLGHPTDIFVPLQRIDPDIVTVGYDQPFDVDDLAQSLHDRGIDADVVRISAYEPSAEQAVTATSEIVDRVLDERTDEKSTKM